MRNLPVKVRKHLAEIIQVGPSRIVVVGVMDDRTQVVDVVRVHVGPGAVIEQRPHELLIVCGELCVLRCEPYGGGKFGRLDGQLSEE